MATEAIVPSAPAAAPVSAPASPAPASAPSGGEPAPADTPTYSRGTAPTSSVDPAKYPIREDYAKALLAEKMGAIPAEGEEKPEAETVPDPAAEPAAGAAPVEAAPATEEAAVPVEEAAKVEPEDDFDLDPPAIVTPESLSKMVTENPEFGKLLEADAKLKGQLYKTAREAAELQPYREIFPDVESAKTAAQSATTFNDVRETFLGSGTKDGTLSTLGKIAELCYEIGDDGQPVMENGQPKIGEDFYGFVDNVVALDLEHRAADVDARLKAGRYATQEERDLDEQRKAALDILRGDNMATAGTELPPELKAREEAVAARERALQERQQGGKVEERRAFEQGLQQEAQKRISDGITRIIANVEKNGAVISPYLKSILPKAIGAKLVRKIQANPVLQSQMQELQRLPANDASRARRIVAIDRAVQQYLPEVAREELREAGIQTKANADAKRAKIQEQAAATAKTEPKGSTGPATQGGAMSTEKAFAQAEAEWKTANPNKPYDKVAKEQSLNRVLQLRGVFK